MMEYITLQNTGLRVSRFCMGGCPMGGYGWGSVQESELLDAIHAALDAGVELRQIEARQQAPDHPILWGVPETNYLKFFLFQVI